SRVAFGQRLADMGGVRQDIAWSRIEIDQARLLTMHAAHMMDTVGNKVAKSEIAAIKVVAPNMALKVLDRAIQVHGAAGVSAAFNPCSSLSATVSIFEPSRVSTPFTRSFCWRHMPCNADSTSALVGSFGSSLIRKSQMKITPEQVEWPRRSSGIV